MIVLPRNHNKHLLKQFLFVLLFLFSINEVSSQKHKADSLRILLENETVDTNRIRLMWQLASSARMYNPDTALYLSQEALYLARHKKYAEGESRALGILANTFMAIGNYPKALEFNLEKLRLEEKRNTPRNLASVLMNIGIVYVFQEEYRMALQYYAEADSVMTKNNVEDLKYNIALNTGDAYNRLDISDSAYFYFSKSLELAKKRKDDQLIGNSLTGLGHSYLKLGDYPASLLNYHDAITLLQKVADDETLCEAALGLAKLYQKLNKDDSARYYANLSLSVSKKDGFLAKEFDVANFLTGHYKKIKNIDSAFAYSDLVHELNDSLNSKAKIREAQVLSSNEQFRQRAIEEEKRIAAKKRYQQLQLLLIGIFIPGLFLLTLLISQSKIHVRVVRVLGVLSLLFFFEYLTLLLHPTVSELTDHIPIYEILIFVGVAAILIPLHHRLEHWLIHRLIHHRLQHETQGKKNEASGK